MGAIHQALLSIAPPASGGAPTFPTIADIWEFWEPARESYADNDPIDTLFGQIAPGPGHNFSHTGATRPTLKTNQINGLAAARFNGAQALHLVDASALTAGHVFIVFWIDNDPPPITAETGLWRFSGAGQGTPEHVPFTDGVIYDACGSTVRKTTVNPGTSLTSPVVYEVISTSSEWTNLLNGTQLFTTATNTVGFAGDMQLGVWGSAFLKGYVAGLYICSAKITGGDRTNLIGYINSRFALSSS